MFKSLRVKPKSHIANYGFISFGIRIILKKSLIYLHPETTALLKKNWMPLHPRESNIKTSILLINKII